MKERLRDKFSRISPIEIVFYAFFFGLGIIFLFKELG